ncbi:MAG TPA: hypothetical protein VM865_00870 [Acidobacteriaceae bacterium]|jgi:uncharacterized coiled-coil protein SlyX|nr:hypothetical protein [Acidobacteriaceae bacterium]
MEEMTGSELQVVVERLLEVATSLERMILDAAEQRTAIAAQADEHVGRIVATTETEREAELERKLAEAEAKIAEMAAAAASQQPSGRKTLPASMASMLSKQGVAVESLEAGALDHALVALSIEQRIAVKSELMRAGMIG